MKSEEGKLDDSALVEGLFEHDAKDVIKDFGGQTVSNFRRKLAENGSMDLMFSYSIISRKGLAHFLPAINDYARSTESVRDCELPGSFAHAIENQLRVNPAAVFSVRLKIESLSKYFLDHLGKFDLDDQWRHEAAAKLTRILESLRRNE